MTFLKDLKVKISSKITTTRAKITNRAKLSNVLLSISLDSKSKETTP